MTYLEMFLASTTILFFMLFMSERSVTKIWRDGVKRMFRSDKEK